MNPTSIRVVKVGGSLLSWADVPVTLQDWLGRQTAMHNVLLPGGGEFADIVRLADKRFGLDEVESHWICVELLHATSRLLASLLPDSKLISRWTYLEHLLKKQSNSEHLILDPVEFLCELEQSAPGEKLPYSWETTSDSIAARVAFCLGADELVLLKSVTRRSGGNLKTLAKLGLVDKFFARAGNVLCTVRIVNLRSTAFDEAAFSCGEFCSCNEKGQVPKELGLDLN